MTSDPDQQSTNRLVSRLTSFTVRLKAPAGPEFSDPNVMAADPRRFMRAFEAGIGTLHLRVIDEMLRIEDTMRRRDSKCATGGHPDDATPRCVRAILRKANDAMAWILLGPTASFLVKRTSLGLPRASLKEQNSDCILAHLREILESGEGCGLWNDATTCINVGDVTARLGGRVHFQELKEGEVNEAAMDLLDGGETTRDAARFYARFGEKGSRQVERMRRQRAQATKVTAFVNEKTETDPVSGHRRSVWDQTSIPTVSFDPELQRLLDTVAGAPLSQTTVDDCLHMLAVNPALARAAGLDGQAAAQELRRTVMRPPPGCPDPLDAVISHDQATEDPIAMPTFLRRLRPESIAKLYARSLQVFYCLDVDRWGKLLKNHRLIWSSRKEGRRNLSKPPRERLLVIGEQVPGLDIGDGRELQLGPGFLRKLLFEGVRPSSMALLYDQPPGQ